VEPLPSLGAYRIHIAREGFANILHVQSGEIMHSRLAPMEEANRLYVGQAQFSERVKAGKRNDPLVVWDVGLGAAANAMAAILCHREAGLSGEKLRPLKIVSFENDLDSLRLATAHEALFPYLRHPAPRALLENGFWQEGTVSWELRMGDFPATIGGDSPEVIFYDMYSAKTCRRPWLPETFARLHAACGNQGSELFTYTVSTASRLAMLLAGFYVARGSAMGGKEETTIAFMEAALKNGWANRHSLLGAEWLQKWQRSAARFPAWLPETEKAGFEAKILKHPQFRNCS